MRPFRDVAAETGLVFQHSNGATGQHYLPEIMGSGAALIDFDNDGDLDVFLVQGSSAGGSNRLFRNELKETGKLRFTDVTERAGVHSGYGMGVAVGDYNNDGRPDLYVTYFGGNVLYRNNGDGTFSDVTAQAGVAVDRWSTSAAFVDYDRDGKLDLFVLNYVNFTVQGNKACFASTGEPDYCTPKAYHPVAARLFHNAGGGRFEDVTERSGIASTYGPGLGVVTGDFSGDGWPDIYVANDTFANLLWVNQRNGTFRESALSAGIAYADDGVARAGMGVTAGDFDGDGYEDILVTNLTQEGATVFRGNAKGEFEDVSARVGLTKSTLVSTGFGTQWFDYDNDGLLDLFIANGAVTLIPEQRGRPNPFEQKNLLFHNTGGQFTGVEAFERLGVGRAAAFGDIDNDGDVDIVVTNNNGPALLLLNETRTSNHWLEVSVEPGARIALMRTGRPPLWRTARTDSGYLSAQDPRVHFGLGERTDVDHLQVKWPDGSSESFYGIGADQLVTIKKGTGNP